MDIIVPAYIVDPETDEMTGRCIHAFEKTKRQSDTLTIVDDSSPFEHRFRGAIRTPKNLGNAGAWNFGIRNGTQEIVLLADNDTVPVVWREQMLDALREADIVFPIISLTIDGKQHRHLAGEFFMFKRSLFDKFGPFDEEYGSYFEDTDFFMKVQRSGGKLVVAEDTLVFHHSQGTFKRILSEEERLVLFNRNKTTYESRYGENYPFLDSRMV